MCLFWEHSEWKKTVQFVRNFSLSSFRVHFWTTHEICDKFCSFLHFQKYLWCVAAYFVWVKKLYNTYRPISFRLKVWVQSHTRYIYTTQLSALYRFWRWAGPEQRPITDKDAEALRLLRSPSPIVLQLRRSPEVSGSRSPNEEAHTLYL